MSFLFDYNRKGLKLLEGIKKSMSITHKTHKTHVLRSSCPEKFIKKISFKQMGYKLFTDFNIILVLKA